MKKINHKRIFLLALRTALLFISSFIIYDTFVNLEKYKYFINLKNKLLKLYIKEFIKFVLIFIIDLMILYILFFLTKQTL